MGRPTIFCIVHDPAVTSSFDPVSDGLGNDEGVNDPVVIKPVNPVGQVITRPSAFFEDFSHLQLRFKIMRLKRTRAF